MIMIKQSKTADTRTCDYTKVSKETLIESSGQHIKDVRKGLRFFSEWLITIGKLHDYDKLLNIDNFYEDFKTGFKVTEWWDNHRKISRHHLLADDGVPENVNLFDVMEMIVDCVMAGMARTGEVYPLEIKQEVLKKAFDNTVELLKQNIKVVE